MPGLLRLCERPAGRRSQCAAYLLVPPIKNYDCVYPAWIFIRHRSNRHASLTAQKRFRRGWGRLAASAPTHMCADRADRWHPCWRLGQSDTAGSAAVHVWLTVDRVWVIVAPKQLRPLDWDAVGVPSASVPTPATAAAAITVTVQAEDARRSAYRADAQRAMDALATEARSVGDEVLWRIHPPGQCV